MTKGISQSKQIGPALGDFVPETQWPSIAFDDKQAHSDVDPDLEDKPSEWPSIPFDDDQDVKDTTDVLADSGDSVASVEAHLEQPDFDHTQSSSSSDQLHVIEQLGAEDMDSSFPLEESMLEKEQELVIPDLGLSEEPVQSNQPSNDQEVASNDAGLEEVPSDLGELRFASDD